MPPPIHKSKSGACIGQKAGVGQQLLCGEAQDAQQRSKGAVAWSEQRDGRQLRQRISQVGGLGRRRQRRQGVRLPWQRLQLWAPPPPDTALCAVDAGSQGTDSLRARTSTAATSVVRPDWRATSRGWAGAAWEAPAEGAPWAWA